MEDPSIGPTLWIAITVIGAILKTLTTEAVTGILVMIGLLLLSAMISGSEIAYFSLSPSQLKDIKTKKKKNNQLILKFLEKPKHLLATILIANNFINVAIVIISTFVTAELFDFNNYKLLGFVIQVIAVTALILLIGEIIPKIYATQFTEKFARIMALPIYYLIKLFYPLSSLLVKSTTLIDKRITKKAHNISFRELTDAIEITSDESTPEEETMILKGIVKFGDIDVKEIMKSRIDVVAVDIKTDYDQLLKTILESGFSRIPAYEDTFDKITGILYIKDLLPHLYKDKGFNWQSLLRQAFFVPENKMINDLLKEFQERTIHLAIVVDEYGGTSGIVTLEDIIEEIVGEISDEFDNKTEEMFYKKIDENNYIFEGKTTLIDFCKILGIEDKIFVDAKGESDTLAGLILELEGKIPAKGESIDYEGLIFKIEVVDNRRIKSIKVTKKV